MRNKGRSIRSYQRRPGRICRVEGTSPVGPGTGLKGRTGLSPQRTDLELARKLPNCNSHRTSVKQGVAWLQQI
ncbi:hypothetical protein DPMN_126349 [Dreissena polymorpha]|uniref:Uncharacterized protein n=1 Tax=Dreissena polymorpha TaxID=45954 RepID=A0A9D4JXV8_DREPO|nr:hypothetical protein DPMN_126349 [Dreissena polymorpha]